MLRAYFKKPAVWIWKFTSGAGKEGLLEEFSCSEVQVLANI